MSAVARGARGAWAMGIAVVLVAALATPAHAAKRPDTVIDGAPASLVSSSTATFTFHSTITPATFTCKLDASAWSSCASPVTYMGLADGRHTFSVFATAGGITDPQPANASWTVDTTAPTVPVNLKAFADRTPSVALSWSASTDANGVAGYDVFRNGSSFASLGAVTSYVDASVSAATTYTYTVRARDNAGNVSAQSTVVAASTPAPFDPHLTRAPYLTDLVGMNVIVNFATDQSGNAATVRFGAVTNGACSLTTTVNASHVTISVNSVFEYQWKANLVLPASGTYCYRAYLGPVDLLAANVSPQFQTQVPLGSTEAYSFAVFGDWGQTDVNGQNADQANVMRQVAASGARFAIMTGDTAYPSGSQGNYGDLQQGGGVFAPAFWTQPGSSIPAFVPAGNHGLARSDANHPLLANWPEDTAVATSGGRYQKDTYCCVNGTNSADYPSMWYAFNAGTARFYVLDAAWADLNTGTATPYANDAAAHWTSTSPEYQWLLADLNAHPSGLKFAFFHYPIYSDQPSENSDASLQGNASLEGLLASKGVNIAFSGHAHIYERNTPATGTGVQSLTTYVTGGAGGDIQSLGTTCLANDAYAIGWSDTNSVGSKCGTARVPTARSQVFHFLKVTVSGSSVTVTPTDENGNTFDVKTYSFKTLPDTYIDSAPPAGTTSSTATFTFHSSGSTATFTCKLDNGAQQSCTSPKSYTGLAQGAHTFSVLSTVNKVADPLPATATWTVDSTPPTTPANFSASATSPFSVGLSWTAATDNTGVTGYDVLRDGVTLTTVSPATSYVDTAVVGASTHTYAVRARDIAGNVSPSTSSITVTTPPPPAPLFGDGFESGDLSAWTSSGGLVPETTLVHGGTTAVDGNTTNGGTFAKKTLSSTYTDAYARVFFDVVSQTDQINVLRMRDAAGNSIGYLYVAPDGSLGFHDDATATNTPTTVVPGPGWHALELHLGINGAASTVEVWLDNVQVPGISVVGGVDLGTAPVGQLQIGDVQTARTYDVVFDDAAFGTSRLGPVADNSPPSVPAGVSAAATSPFSVDVSWLPSIDDVGVTGYDVLRNGTVIASTDPSTTSYTDQTVSASSAYTYTVRARDASGNMSAQSAPAAVNTPSAALPVFADGFESGTLTAWTSSTGLSVENTDVRTGGFAAEGNTVNGGTFAKKTLATTYTDAYARVAVEIKSQASQVNLLRLRDATGASIGYLYVSANGHLGFHDDATAVNNASVVTVGSGWHALELHLGVNGAAGTVEVWLDDIEVPDLSVVGSANLGTAPVGQFQIGDAQTGIAYDVVFDDAGFATGRLGAAGDGTAPSVPANVSATANSAFSVGLSWAASSDDTAVAAYDISRNGNVIASVDGATTSFTDTSVLSSTAYSYTVSARDVWGNTSAPSAAAGVTTPAGNPPLFTDGFESGDLSAWTSSSGLSIESTDVRSGAFAAEGNTTNGNTIARKTLGATYADAYARVGFEIKSQSSQINLLRLRDATGVSIGYVYVTTAGALGFHNDATATNTTSTTAAGAGWHSVELHANVSGTTSTVEVWLDGVPVSGLSTIGSVNLGTSPVGQLQIGDAQTARTYDVLFDDAAFGASRLGP